MFLHMEIHSEVRFSVHVCKNDYFRFTKYEVHNSVLNHIRCMKKRVPRFLILEVLMLYCQKGSVSTSVPVLSHLAFVKFLVLWIITLVPTGESCFFPVCWFFQ